MGLIWIKNEKTMLLAQVKVAWKTLVVGMVHIHVDRDGVNRCVVTAWLRNLMTKNVEENTRNILRNNEELDSFKKI